MLKISASGYIDLTLGERRCQENSDSASTPPRNVSVRGQTCPGGHENARSAEQSLRSRKHRQNRGCTDGVSVPQGLLRCCTCPHSQYKAAHLGSRQLCRCPACVSKYTHLQLWQLCKTLPRPEFLSGQPESPFFLMPKKVLVSAAFTIFSTRFAGQSDTPPTGCIPSVSLHNYRCVKMCMCPRLCPSTHIVVVLDVQTPLQVWDSDWASHWAAHSSTHEYCSLSPPSDTFHPFSSCLPRPIESCLMHCPPAPPYTTAIHTSCVGVSLGVYSIHPIVV